MRGLLTVVTAAKTSHLTTAATVKRRLRITSADEDDEENIRAWIDDASDAIASELNRVLGLETVSEVFQAHLGQRHRQVRDSDAFNMLVLQRRPVSVVTSITDGAGNVVDPTLYVLIPDAGMIRLANNCVASTSSVFDPLWPHGKLTVLYTAGYDLTDAKKRPRPLERACIRLVSHYRSSETRDPSVKSIDIPGVSRKEFWVGTVGENGALPPEVIDLISPFRDIVVA